MENRYALFHVASMLNVLILVVSFTGVISSPMPNIREVMKNDTNLCEASQFLYDLESTKRCAFLPYPSASLNFTYETLDTFLCLGVYDTAYKICQYSNQLQISPSDTAVLPPYTEKFVPRGNVTQENKFCDSLHGFTSSYNKIDSFLKSLVENLNKPHICQIICFGLKDKLNPLCSIFAWIKKIDDIKKANRIEIKHDPTTSDKLVTTRSNETANNSGIVVDAKKILEENETNKQNTNQFLTNSANDIVENANLNESINVESDAEKAKSEKSSKVQKKLDVPSETQKPMFEGNRKNYIENKETNVAVTKPTKNTSANSESQVPSINDLAGNVPKNEEKGEDFYKEQSTDDLKTSTLSENTQDHYDGENPEDTDDADGTIPQSTRNQNENVQEVFDIQKNLQYPNIRTEDDSHFFTYFTVVTVACIAGYIGYHNKQKILAIVLEGRRSRSNRGRRRPSTANYRKLDCTLEEAVTSQCNANVTHVIY
ncbi:unnamed protein product [Lasius platythorax]|uniref:Uncharacterized protein n=1 Tax=Lasius platythorax TaxID=488582 RepID=A0AAV2P2C2_9HYME